MMVISCVVRWLMVGLSFIDGQLMSNEWLADGQRIPNLLVELAP